MSRWFKDYLYIPLGGNRRGPVRTYFNLLVVFGLCGLWHGASWTFVIWGFYHGLLLIVERITGLRRMANGHWAWLTRVSTFILVVFGWVLFRSDTLAGALDYIKIMVLPVDRPLTYELYSVLHWRNITFMALAALSTMVAWRLPTCEALLQARGVTRTAVALVLILLVLPYCAAFVMAGTSHPFIYFRF